MPKQVTGTKRADARATNSKKPGASARGHKRKRSGSSRKKSAGLNESSRICSELKLRLNGPPGPRIPIGEALRERGLDEFAIADTYVHVVGKLTAPKPNGGGVEKLLVDVLKECSRQIETSQPPMRSANPDAPVIVQLVHSVARPVRPPLDPQSPPRILA
jgi:hypothetical protein